MSWLQPAPPDCDWRRQREPLEGVLFTTGGNGGDSVEGEEDEEELLDKDDDEDDDDDDKDTELSSSSFSGWRLGIIFAVALVCMRGGGTSSGVSLFGLVRHFNGQVLSCAFRRDFCILASLCFGRQQGQRIRQSNNGTRSFR